MDNEDYMMNLMDKSKRNEDYRMNQNENPWSEDYHICMEKNPAYIIVLDILTENIHIKKIPISNSLLPLLKRLNGYVNFSSI